MNELNKCEVCGRPINDEDAICEFCLIDVKIKEAYMELEM